MAIQTSVGVRDNMSAAFRGITGAINTCLGAFMSLDNATETGLNPAQFQAVQTSLYQMNSAVAQLDNSLDEAGNEQKNLNNQIEKGSHHADGLMGKIKGIVGAYVGLRSLKGALDVSDEMTTTAARLDMMNDGLQTTDELQNMVMASAQRARGSYSSMAEMVAKIGNNAGDAFGNNSQEIIAFTELVQKQFKIAGASATESSAAMLQLTQALGSGVLRGEELNSIFEQAPNLIQNIANYMGVSIGEIRELASEGQITADIVKNAMFAASDDINAKFDSMPKTWSDIWTSMQNQAIGKFQPVLQRLNQIANSERFQHTFDGLMNGLNVVAWIATGVIDTLVSGAAFVQDNWDMIAPIFWGIVAAVTAYAAIQGICAAISGAMAIAEGVKAAATALSSGATFAATAAQHGFNAALLACPITWIVLAIVALVAALIVLCQWIAKNSETANSWFGVMMGGVFVVGAAFKNFGLLVANIALGIWDAIGACCSNIGIAFHNVICNVQSWWYGLLATAMEVVAGICEALNKLPFVEFDYSGITTKASEYASKAAEAQGNKQEYKDVGAAFDKGFGTFDAFGDGWAKNAYESGAKWGDGVSDKVKGAFDFGNIDTGSIFSGGALGGISDQLGGINESTGSAADSAGAIKDSMDIQEEQLKWMKDIAEREVIDRTVFRDISVNLGGVSNTVNNMNDLDGVADYLGNVIAEQMAMSGEGVHA